MIDLEGLQVLAEIRDKQQRITELQIRKQYLLLRMLYIISSSLIKHSIPMEVEDEFNTD